MYWVTDLRKLIKYEKHKSKLKEKENINLARNSENKVKPIELTKNKCQNACCNINKSDVFERLSKPRTNSKLCSKAVSTVGVQTDLPHSKSLWFYEHVKNNCRYYFSSKEIIKQYY